MLEVRRYILQERDKHVSLGTPADFQKNASQRLIKPPQPHHPLPIPHPARWKNPQPSHPNKDNLQRVNLPQRKHTFNSSPSLCLCHRCATSTYCFIPIYLSNVAPNAKALPLPDKKALSLHTEPFHDVSVFSLSFAEQCHFCMAVRQALMYGSERGADSSTACSSQSRNGRVLECSFSMRTWKEQGNHHDPTVQHLGWGNISVFRKIHHSQSNHSEDITDLQHIFLSCMNIVHS